MASCLSSYTDNGENAVTPTILFLVHLSRSVLPSGLHCPNLWPSGLLACVLHTDFSLSGDCHCLSLAVILTFIGAYGVFAAIA